MAKSIKYPLILIASGFILYVVSVIFMPIMVSDLVAVICDFLAAGLVFHAIFQSKNTAFRITFILLGLAILSWAIADALWFVYDHLLYIVPGSSTLITLFYFLTNVFLVAATVRYTYYRLRRWDTVQLILDGVVFSIGIVWLILSAFYDRDLSNLEHLMNYSIMNTVSIIGDIFIIVVIIIWYLSIRKGILPVFIRILVGAVLAYILLDLFYYYLYNQGLYVPDSYLDTGYLFSLLCISLSIKMYYIRFPSEYTNPNPNISIGYRHKVLVLLCCPILILIFDRLDVLDVILYGLLILIHEYSSYYIQKTIRNQELLDEERGINKQLEQLVSEKTNDLKAANEELRQRNEDLIYSNMHDPLTGLHNRAYFMNKLEEAIKAAVRGERAALILWNVDNLKGINDTYGHFTGDQILIRHAARVKKLLEGTGVLTRLGGDEFAFLARGNIQKPEAVRIARQVVRTCDEPFRIDGYTFHVTVSAGISIYPQCATDRSTLMRNADIAMHYAKETKPESHIATYIDIDLAMNRKYLIGNSLKLADYDHDLRLHYQPQFRISDRKLIGMEALLRWNCPGIGPISPAEFIPIAEAENLIIPIGNWVIENAVRRIAAWNTAYQSDLRMGINISPKQFDQPSTFEVLAAAIARYKAEYSWIDIEITEGVALDNEDSEGNIKKHLKDKGISVSIDDFGTGYSSLGYLTILSFERLKIAKPLIDKITTDESSRKIVASIILLAQSLDLRTIAEGVETKAQFNLLAELGCDQIQGYYLGKPVPENTFETRFLKAAADTVNATVQ